MSAPITPYQRELLQVACVAIAAYCNSRWGTDHPDCNDFAIMDLLEERLEQYKKWGVQQRTPSQWVTILAEELGEVAREVLEHEEPAIQQRF